MSKSVSAGCGRRQKGLPEPTLVGNESLSLEVTFLMLSEEQQSKEDRRMRVRCWNQDGVRRPRRQN